MLQVGAGGGGGLCVITGVEIGAAAGAVAVARRPCWLPRWKKGVNGLEITRLSMNASHTLRGPIPFVTG